MQTTIQIEGLEVHLEGTGEQTLLMIHGWPDTYRLWDAQVAQLKTQYRCVRFSLPGYDISQPPRGVSVARMMDIFQRIIQAVSPDQPVVLMLHDWGCLFGYQLLMTRPDLVSKVIGVDVGDAGSGAHMRALSAKAKLSIAGYQLWLVLAWRLGGALGTRMTRAMARWLGCASDPQSIHVGMNYPYDMQWTGSHGSFRSIVRIKPPCPMLFIYGTRKPFMFHSDAWADALRAQPGCQVLPLDTGHWVMRDQPEAFNQAVLAWLSSSASRS